MKKLSIIICVAMAGSCLSCQRAAITSEHTKDVPSAALSGVFTPPDGKTLLIIGQTVKSVDEYVAAAGKTPGGVTGYTSIQKLEGLKTLAHRRRGGQHIDYLARTYSNSVVAIGLYAVDHLSALNEGRSDDKIDMLIDQLASYEQPVFLRFGYEFDGQWNHYGPEDYVLAWRRFHQRLHERKVPNVAMVWQSATYCLGTYGNHPVSAWYPGDEYVDWFGLSYFKPDQCAHEPLEEFIAMARNHNKPVLIAEASPMGYDLSELAYSEDGQDFESLTGEDIWRRWYAPFFDFIGRHADIIRAVAYIDDRWDDDPVWGPPYDNGYWGDSRVHLNEYISARWHEEISGASWLHGGPDLFKAIGRPTRSSAKPRTD